ncbi:nucleotidyl transferase AbiEii/AbiGii toxin family protein [bacterium]|nr:nucleotidyl transferase AbiEii/AbiGii toxin family protein [bacterium]
MSTTRRIIDARLSELEGRTDREQINGAKELVQEITLFALSRTDFFKSAAFMGGTALRIFHGLNKFSEDLDFSLYSKGTYSLERVVEPTLRELRAWGLQAEFQVRNIEKAVEIGWLKETSLGGLLHLEHPLAKGQKLQVKLELDTNPPDGANLESREGRFPIRHAVTLHDRPTLFAGKLHALLCRPYTKGRDWYDLIHYLDAKTDPNLLFLRNALQQMGPHKRSTPTRLDKDWLREALIARINEVKIQEIQRDLLLFLAFPGETTHWNREYFLNRIATIT